MFSLISSLLLGLPGLADKLLSYLAKRTDAQVQSLGITTAAKRDEIVAELQAQTLQAQASASIIMAEQGHWYTAIIRPAFAAPFVIYDFKIVVWDKVLALGVTDPLSADMLHLEAVIVGAYFGALAVENAARIVRRK
jgi:hypothetical protein